VSRLTTTMTSVPTGNPKIAEEMLFTLNQPTFEARVV
jgi:hypothetical protein